MCQNVTLARDAAAPWIELNRAMNVQVLSVASLETSIAREHYSLKMDRSAALKGCQNSAVWKFITKKSDS